MRRTLGEPGALVSDPGHGGRALEREPRHTRGRRCARGLFPPAPRLVSAPMPATVPELDHRHLWHPFTQQREWCAEPPLVIERGEGTDLIDVDGNRYIDGVSSLWCNVHGHRHPVIDAAVREQLDRIAHSTMLGLTHAGAAQLAARLVELAPPGLSRVFYSESGSTAVEIALKMAFQYWHQRGGADARRTGYVCLDGAYHGDTIGSVSVGGIDLFHGAYGPLLFDCHRVEPGDARGARARARRPPRRDRGADRRAAGPGRRRDPGPAAGLPAPGARAGDGARRAADRRRGRDRLRAHRDDVRLRAGAGRAGPALPRQGPDRGLSAARGDPDQRTGLRGVPRRPRGATGPSFTATPSPATRSPAQPRSRASTCSRARRRCFACSRRSACSASCWPRSRRCPRWPRSAGAG